MFKDVRELREGDIIEWVYSSGVLSTPRTYWGIVVTVCTSLEMPSVKVIASRIDSSGEIQLVHRPFLHALQVRGLVRFVKLKNFPKEVLEKYLIKD